MSLESDDNVMLTGEKHARAMEIPDWLSTLEVTAYIVGIGGTNKRQLEAEHNCTITITGEGSGGVDPTAPGFGLPHLLVTIEGEDFRELGRARRAIENSLIDYVIENTPENEDPRKPPPSLGRLLYSLALSAANASPNTKDRSENRTVLSRAHYPMSVLKQSTGKSTKKVWMNVVELPTDKEGRFHGRFLAGKGGRLFEFYRTRYNCQVEIYGVWGEEEDDPAMLCDPYVLVTCEENKQQVDRCVQFINYRIIEHEEKFQVSRNHEDMEEE